MQQLVSRYGMMEVRKYRSSLFTKFPTHMTSLIPKSDQLCTYDCIDLDGFWSVLLRMFCAMAFFR